MLGNFSPCDGGELDLGSPLHLLETSQEQESPDLDSLTPERKKQQQRTDLLVSVTPDVPPTAVLANQFSAKPVSTLHVSAPASQPLSSSPPSSLVDQLAKMAAELSVDEIAQEIGESFLGESDGDASKSEVSVNVEELSKPASKEQSFLRTDNKKVKTQENKPPGHISVIKNRLSAIKENLEPRQQSKTILKPGQKKLFSGNHQISKRPLSPKSIKSESKKTSTPSVKTPSLPRPNMERQPRRSLVSRQTPEVAISRSTPQRAVSTSRVTPQSQRQPLVSRTTPQISASSSRSTPVRPASEKAAPLRSASSSSQGMPQVMDCFIC